MHHTISKDEQSIETLNIGEWVLGSGIYLYTKTTDSWFGGRGVVGRGEMTSKFLLPRLGR